MNLRAWLLLLYPQKWRVRYGDEVLALLEARPLLLRDMADVALGALDAHIHPEMLNTGASLDERMLHLMQKLRSVEITIFASWIAFVVAGLHLNGMMDDSPYMAASGLGRAVSVDFTKPMSIAWDALAGGSLVALLAVLVGGLPLAYAAWQRAPQARRLFLVPVIAFIATIVLPIAGAALVVFNLHGTISPLLNPGFMLGYGALFIAAAAASTWAVARAITLAKVPEGLLRFAIIPGIVTVLAMALMLGGALVWGIYAHMQFPGLFDSANFLAGYATFPTWGLDITVMTVATVIAAAAIIRWIGARGAPEEHGVVTA